MMAPDPALLKRTRLLIVLFAVALALSGVTAFPLVHELRLLEGWFGEASAPGAAWPALGRWISHVHTGLEETALRYPFIAYGSDWLAFAHLVIAAAFRGPYVDPVRNKWVVQWGMIACAGILPLALICGPIRGIPIFWTLIDISFGLIGIVPLLLILRNINRLEAA